jgi:WD40 repeat protein
VSAAAINRNGSIWLSRPTAAATASLAAVTFFIVLLGLAFLPREAQSLIDSQYVSVTHCIDMGAGRPAVSIYWSISRFGRPGWQHHLAVHLPSDSSKSLAYPCRDLRPLSLAKGPDADHALVGNWDGSIHSIDLRLPDAEPACIARQPDGAVVALAVSADGQNVLSQSAFNLHAWNSATSGVRWRRSDVAPYCFALRPDNSAVIIGTSQGELLEVDLPTGRTRRSIAKFHRPLLAISLSADGSKLAALQANDRVSLLDSVTGDRLWNDQIIRSCRTAAGRIISFSPCGTMLVTAGEEMNANSLAVWSVATGRKLCELRGHDNVVIGAAFTHSGRLRSWGADGTIREWNLAARSDHRFATLAPPPFDI